jgi:S1-C subfamily serine protease
MKSVPAAALHALSRSHPQEIQIVGSREGKTAVDVNDSFGDATMGYPRARLVARYGRLPGWWQSGLAAMLLALAMFIGGCALPGTNPGQGLSTPTTAPSSSSASSTVLQAPVNVIPAVQPSVVEVQSANANGSGAIGSGEIISSDGNIVTNDHVVHGFTSYRVLLSSGKTLPAKLVGEAPEDDLAVLKVDATGLRPIKLGDSSAVQVGEFVLAIGAPLGLQQSATFGIVSALNRTASEAPDGPAGVLTGLIQTSAPINPGNSGGALVNLQKELIGIPTLSATIPSSGAAAEGIGFAIPVNRVKFIADQLVKYGHVVNSGQGFLGITGADVTPDLASANNLPINYGVLVTGFVPDAAGPSPAQQAGMQQGDIIIAVNGTRVSGNAELAGVLLSLKPGTRVQVTVQRGSSQQNMTVTLGERPTSATG